jgi:hypothetical protein
MLNPFGPQQNPGSYINLRKRILQSVQYMKINDQIFKVIQNAYEPAMIKENVVLSRAKRSHNGSSTRYEIHMWILSVIRQDV